MRIIQDKWDDVKIQQANKEHRSLWDFTRRYREVKKAGGITPEFRNSRRRPAASPRSSGKG